MVSKEIKYIGFYDVCDSNIKRNISLAAINKMDYIAESLISLGYKVHIVSPAYSIEKNARFIKKEKRDISSDKVLTNLSSFGIRNRFFVFLNIVILTISLFLWLLKNVSKNEKIIIYHSLWVVLPVYFAKKIKRFEYVLELEEIYSDITHKSMLSKFCESLVIRNAKSYILATKSLSMKIESNKKFICLYGTYKVKNRNDYKLIEGSEKIRLLYAGIIDREKAGAYNALEAASLLSDKYILNIIGFGEILPFLEVFEECRSKSKTTINFDGIKTGVEYENYCLNHDIGLNTQISTGKYISTSFPSKILSYLSMGLNVISCDIKSVRESPFGDLINYYTEESPVAIAKAIEDAIIFPKEVLQDRVRDLNDKFINELKYIIKNE